MRQGWMILLLSGLLWGCCAPPPLCPSPMDDGDIFKPRVAMR